MSRAKESSLMVRSSEVHHTSEDKGHVAAPQWTTDDSLDVRLSELCFA